MKFAEVVQEGFVNQVRWGKVPIGQWLFTYGTNSASDSKMIENSAKERKMTVYKRLDIKTVVLKGDAGQHSALTASLQSLGVGGYVKDFK